MGSPGTRGGIVLFTAGFGNSKTVYENNGYMFLIDVAVANVITHETLFHKIAGKKDKVSKIVKPIPLKKQHFIEVNGLTPFLIQNEGTIDGDTLKAVKTLLNLK